MEKKELNVLLYSSGLDSYLSYFKLKHNLDYVYFVDSGIKYNKIEKDKFINFFKNENNNIKTTILTYDKMFELENKITHFLPFRNYIYIFLVLSHIWKNYNYNDDKKINVYIGGMKDDRINDNNKKLINKFNTFINSLFNTKLVEVKSVFDWKITKKDALNDYKMRRYSIQKFFNNTFSCYEPYSVLKPNKLIFDNRKKFKISNNDNNRIILKENNQLYYYSFECMSCKACLRKNITIFNSLGILLPFHNMTLFDTYFNDKTIPNQRKEDILTYYNKLMEGI